MPQIASEPKPCCQTSTIRPHAAATESRFRRTALSGRTSERNARASSRNVSARDQRDHEREVAVDGVEEVGALRGLAADRRRRPAGRRGGADAVERRAAGGRVAVLGRDDRDDRGPVAAPVGGRDRAADAVDAGERLCDGVGIARADERVERRERPGADAGAARAARGRRAPGPAGRASRPAGCRAGSRRRRRRARPGRRSTPTAATQRWRTTSRAQADQPRLGAVVAAACAASRAAARSSPGRPAAA